MSNVVNLGVVTSLDHHADYALRLAAEADLQSAVVVGWRKDGSFFFASSIAAPAEVLLLFKLAERDLLDLFDEATP